MTVPIYKRNRSKKVELLGRHHDHNDKTYYKGFRMLTLAWSDGHSLVPLGFELLSNAAKEKRIGATPDYDGRTHFGKRCKRATQKTLDVASSMLDWVHKKGVTADYLVCDSWFSFPSHVRALSTHLPVVCMLKDLPSISFLHGRRIYQLKSLYEKVNKRKRGNASEVEVRSYATLIAHTGLVPCLFRGIENHEHAALSANHPFRAS